MSEYQVTYWRELPSMVAARDGEQTTKTQLAPRFAEAVDEAAMRLGDTGSEDYLAGWRRSEWTPAEADPTTVVEQVSADLEAQWPQERLTGYLDGLGSVR